MMLSLSILFCLFAWGEPGQTTSAPSPEVAEARLQQRMDEKELNEELALLKQTMSLLPPAKLTNDLIRRLPYPSREVQNDTRQAFQRSTLDLAYGASNILLDGWTSSSKVKVSVVCLATDIIAYKITFHSAWITHQSALRKSIAENGFSGTVTESQRGLEWQHEQPARMERLNQRIANDLGSLQKCNIPAELAEAYSLLSSAYADLHFGTSCGYGGKPPAGHDEIQNLIRAGRWDLIKNVLRGPNPVGRLYAAEALLRADLKADKDKKIIDPDDRQTIDTIRYAGIRIPRCSGCFGGETNAAQELHYLSDEAQK
jgi:hypothetical protein